MISIKDAQATTEAFGPQKRTSITFKQETLLFSIFVGHFDLDPEPCKKSEKPRGWDGAHCPSWQWNCFLGSNTDITGKSICERHYKGAPNTLLPAKHRVGRVLIFFSSRRNWAPPTITRRRECPLPFGTGGRGTLTGERGGGRVPIPTMGHTLWYSVYLCTLSRQSNDKN
jgi:hypothetical protein